MTYEWRNSMWIPIYKKGAHIDGNNYKTVTLISLTSKVLLYIINEQVINFLLLQIVKENSRYIPQQDTREPILKVKDIIDENRDFNILRLLIQ